MLKRNEGTDITNKRVQEMTITGIFGWVTLVLAIFPYNLVYVYGEASIEGFLVSVVSLGFFGLSCVMVLPSIYNIVLLTNSRLRESKAGDMFNKVSNFVYIVCIVILLRLEVFEFTVLTGELERILTT